MMVVGGCQPPAVQHQGSDNGSKVGDGAGGHGGISGSGSVEGTIVGSRGWVPMGNAEL